MENVESGVKTLEPIQGAALALSSISIQEQTLSAVLINMLPTNSSEKAEENAKTAAKAVKAAFDELNMHMAVDEGIGAYVYLTASQLQDYVSRYGVIGIRKNS